MPYVYSTLSSGVDYTIYAKSNNDVAIPERHISIAGGANVTTSGRSLVTPYGVATKVEDEDIAALRENEVFKMHERNGFVKISDSKEDPDVVAADLTGRDDSAPLVDQDFPEGQAPIVPEAPKPAASEPRRNGRRA